MLRKVAVAAASNPHVEIRQDGEQFYIKTSTSVRTTEINFHIGEEFNEETVDGRKCKVDPLYDVTLNYIFRYRVYFRTYPVLHTEKGCVTLDCMMEQSQKIQISQPDKLFTLIELVVRSRDTYPTGGHKHSRWRCQDGP